MTDMTDMADMADMAAITKRVSKGYFFHGQIQHWLFLLLLIPGTWFWIKPALDGQTFLGLSDRMWVMLVVGTAVAQQILGWLVFRLQLCHAWLSKRFGQADLTVWGMVFFPLLLGRLFFSLAVGLSDTNSLGFWRPLAIIVGLILLIPAIYTLWSVKAYFGIERALGGDHFRARYQTMPLVKQGAFRYSDNAMYSFVFLIFWAIALFCNSRAALGLALFQHTYIWVHMYCTENPDVAILYGNKKETANSAD
jgi:hypothetical protein